MPVANCIETSLKRFPFAHFNVTLNNITTVFSLSEIYEIILFKYFFSCIFKVKLSSLNLDDHAKKKLIKLVGERYCKTTDVLTIKTDR